MNYPPYQRLKDGKPIFTVYVLTDPREGYGFHYVGKTSLIPSQRLTRHLSEARKKAPDGSYFYKGTKQNWIRELLALNLRPVLREVSIHENDHDACVVELELIRYSLDRKLPLVNNSGKRTIGRPIGSRCSEATKKKMRASWKDPSIRARRTKRDCRTGYRMPDRTLHRFQKLIEKLGSDINVTREALLQLRKQNPAGFKYLRGWANLAYVPTWTKTRKKVQALLDQLAAFRVVPITEAINPSGE